MQRKGINIMKAYLYTIIYLTVLSLLIGCGAGEEDESNGAPSNSAPSNNGTTPTTVPVEEIITTGELVSDPNFNLSASIELTVTLPSLPSASTDYFINICTSFTNDNNVIQVNYQSCKLRTTLTSQTQQFTLSLSTTETQLVAQVWPIENGAQPVNVFWNIRESGDNWQVTL